MFGLKNEVNVNVNKQLGFEETNTINGFKETTIASEVTVEPQRAVAIWQSSYNIKLIRADGTQVSIPLSINSPSLAVSQFPEQKTVLINNSL